MNQMEYDRGDNFLFNFMNQMEFNSIYDCGDSFPFDFKNQRKYDHGDSFPFNFMNQMEFNSIHDRGDSFPFDLNKIKFSLAQNRQENCHHDQIPSDLKGNQFFF